MIARRASWLVAALALLGAAGCSALLDWGDFSGGTNLGTGDGGSGGDGSTADAFVHPDGSPLGHCAAPMQCVTAPPAGWTGPVELFVATSGTAPSCNDPFAATPAFDGQGGTLDAQPATCTACSCGAPSGAACAGPVMTFYVDDTCSTTLGNPLTVTGSCSTTPIGAFGTTVAAPTVTGTCSATGGVATKPPVTWEQVARACGPAATPGPADCDAGQVCAPTPSSPFATQACVMQPGAATACPPEYPQGPQVFYTGVDDQRGCSACTCAGPTGGSCTIGNPAIDACPPLSASWAAPNTCSPITGPEPVRLHGGPPTLVDAGTCTLSGGGAPSGAATATGATSFCCAP